MSGNASSENGKNNPADGAGAGSGAVVAPSCEPRRLFSLPDNISAGRIAAAAVIFALAADILLLRHERGVNILIVSLVFAAMWLMLMRKSGSGRRLPFLATFLFLILSASLASQHGGAADVVFYPLWLGALAYLGIASRNRLLGMENCEITGSGPRLFPAAELASGRGTTQGDATGARESMRQILVGLLVAIPIVSVLLVLMGAADRAFESALMGLSESLKNLPGHVFWIIVIAAALAWWTTFLLLARAEQPAPERRHRFPLLSSIVVILCIVIVLAYFLYIHFQTLMMNEAEIKAATGMDIRTYIRRGFAELLAAEMIVGATLLFIIHSAAWRAAARVNHKLLAWLLILLTACLSVSAAARLAYYIDEKGLSLVRSLNAVGIPLSFACLAFVAYLVVRPMRINRSIGIIAQMFLIFYVAWACSFPVQNIAWYNADKYVQGHPIELEYLQHLGPDAYPALMSVISRGPLQPGDLNKHDEYIKWHLLNAPEYNPFRRWYEYNILEYLMMMIE